MPIESVYDEATNTRTHTVTGTYDGPGLIAAIRQVYESPGFVLRARAVWDVSQGDFAAVTRDELRVVASYIQSAWRGTTELRAALVTGSDLNFGLARMYEQLQCVYRGGSLRVFREAGPAWSWILAED